MSDVKLSALDKIVLVKKKTIDITNNHLKTATVSEECVMQLKVKPGMLEDGSNFNFEAPLEESYLDSFISELKSKGWTIT